MNKCEADHNYSLPGPSDIQMMTSECHHDIQKVTGSRSASAGRRYLVDWTAAEPMQAFEPKLTTQIFHAVRQQND